MKPKQQSRWRRVLFHQHEQQSITYWGTLHISEDFDMKRFRKQLARLSNISFVGVIEQKSKTARPHFHFLFTSDPIKKTFRELIKSSLCGQKFRLQVDKIKDHRAIFHYLTKSDYYEGRCVFEVGNFWVEKTEQLRKMTPEEVKHVISKMTSSDNKLALCRMYDIITDEQASDPQFIGWWRYAGRTDTKIAMALDYVMTDCWDEFYNPYD